MGDGPPMRRPDGGDMTITEKLGTLVLAAVAYADSVLFLCL
jgi:hypothetical protein